MFTDFNKFHTEIAHTMTYNQSTVFHCVPQCIVIRPNIYHHQGPVAQQHGAYVAVIYTTVYHSCNAILGVCVFNNATIPTPQHLFPQQGRVAPSDSL